MRKKFLLLSLLSVFSLTSCAFLDFIKNGANSSEPSGKTEQEENHDKEPPKIKTKVGEFYGGLSVDDKYTGYEFSKSTNVIHRPTTGRGDIKIYAFNDFHGAVQASDGKAGLKFLGCLLKEVSMQENTLIIDQGDTWQGSLESNYEYGAIVQDVFNYAGVSCRTVGNHDFDWGLSHLQSTNNRKIGDDYIPTLAANVYDYSSGKVGSTQQSQYGKEYATFILDNGVKVGVIGVIGDSQITTICSQLVSNIAFTNHIVKIQELSDYLRIDKQCDVIIASAHEGSSELLNQQLSTGSPKSGKRYVDLVLGGHKHTRRENTENDVKFVQWDADGASLGMVELGYSFKNNSIDDSFTNVSTINSWNWDLFVMNHPSYDRTIVQMVDDYIATTTPISQEVVSTKLTGDFNTSSFARVMTEAIYDRVSQTYDLDFACCNYSREGFSGSSFTYGDLYTCFPFDNQIILMDVSSYVGCNYIKWNFGYREDTTLQPDYGGTYKCAIVDYVALHQNEYREFDDFPDAANGYQVFNDTDGEPPTYRDILYSYLKKNSKTFNASDYSSATGHFVG